MVWGKGPASFFFMWMSSFPSTICCPFLIVLLFPLLSFPHLRFLAPLLSTVWLYNCGFVSGFSARFHLSICFSLWQHRTVLITVALCNKLKSGSVRLPALLFFSVMDSQVPWESVNFRIDFSVSAKIAFGILIEIVLNLWITFGGIEILTMLFSNPWTWGVFLCICIFNFFQQCFIIFNLQVFHLLNYGYSWVFISFWYYCKWNSFLNFFSGLFIVNGVEVQLIFLCWFSVLQLCWIRFLVKTVNFLKNHSLKFSCFVQSLFIKNFRWVWNLWLGHNFLKSLQEA